MKTIILFVIGVILSGPMVALADEKPPEYLQSFNPTNGFKPAQKNLTEIFLQLAGSLEAYGSPEPYLRHVKSENARIDAKYQRKYGRAGKSYCPSYMTDEYVDKLAKNWNLLSPKLGLKPYAQETGNLMRDAIKGTRGTGTIIVEIFNQYQDQVFDGMKGGGDKIPDFDALKSQLVARLELDKKGVNEEQYEITRRDAVTFSLGIKGITSKLFKKLDANLKPEDSERIKAALTSMFMDVGRMAQSELEAGIAEWGLDGQTTASK